MIKRLGEMEHVDRRELLSRLVAISLTSNLAPAVPASADAGTGRWTLSGGVPVLWVPLEILTGNMLLIGAKIEGRPVRALLDSGSGATVISPGIAVELGLRSDDVRTISGLTGRAAVRLVEGIEVAFGSVARRLPFALIGELAAPDRALGRTIDVILGADMFAGNCISLDFHARRFAVTPSGSFVPGPGWTAVPLGRGSSQELFVCGSIAGGDPVPLMLDLGSTAALMLSQAYVDEHGLSVGRPVSTAALGGVEGVRVVGTFTTDLVAIAGLSGTDIPTLVPQSWQSTSTVGNIGLPLIAQFNVVIDVTAGQIWLQPVPLRERLPMLKDRSGLGLAVGPTALTVVHVAPGSPASRATWQPGEQIVAVNGVTIGPDYTRGSLWRWRYGEKGTVIRLATSVGATRTLTLSDYF